MRQVLNRYLYSCDHYVTHRSHRGPAKARCGRVEVIDAVCDLDADRIARERGWRGVIGANGAWVCKGVHQRKDAV